jgi:hypothetical protein
MRARPSQRDGKFIAVPLPLDSSDNAKLSVCGLVSSGKKDKQKNSLMTTSGHVSARPFSVCLCIDVYFEKFQSRRNTILKISLISSIDTTCDSALAESRLIRLSIYTRNEIKRSIKDNIHQSSIPRFLISSHTTTK